MFHFAFRFGFGKHFSFNFVFGQPPVTDDEFPKPSRTSCDWPPNISIKKTDPLGKPLDTKVATKHCSLFRLPPEIRTMIYQELLVSESRIRNADRYLVCTQTPILSERKRIHDVDAVFMRTCRSVYDETMPILYGNNVFLFENPDNIRYFRSKGLERPWLLGMVSCCAIGTKLTFVQCSISKQHHTVALPSSDMSFLRSMYKMHLMSTNVPPRGEH